jgi:thiosulfate/3-mercaptopyruvate sulfurtransferase
LLIGTDSERNTKGRRPDVKKLSRYAAMFVMALLISQTVQAGLVTVSELAEMMEKGDLVVVSTRSPKDYAKVHIPGAVNLWHKDLYKEGDIQAILKSPEEIAEVLGNLGISADKTIVVYDSGKTKFAGRVYWILEYMGAKDVRMLDGNMKMWRKGRKPVTKDAVEITPAKFVASPVESIYASIDYVKSGLGNDGFVLLDARAEDEYCGEKGETKRKGHIPGSIRLDYVEVLNEDGTLKSKEDLAKVFKDAGVTPDKDVVLYCETSVRAGIVYLALTSVLDYPKVRVYDGALYEWSADAANAVEAKK